MSEPSIKWWQKWPTDKRWYVGCKSNEVHAFGVDSMTCTGCIHTTITSV